MVLVILSNKTAITQKLYKWVQKKLLPIGFPSMYNIRILYIVEKGLVIKKIKHVFYGKRQHISSVSCAEDTFKQIIHKVLQRTLKRYKAEELNLDPLMLKYNEL